MGHLPAPEPSRASIERAESIGRSRCNQTPGARLDREHGPRGPQLPATSGRSRPPGPVPSLRLRHSRAGEVDMTHFFRELRFGTRSLTRQPAMALLAMVAFSLGIGLVTTMFSIVHGALRDLPFERGDRLLHLERNNLAQGMDSL